MKKNHIVGLVAAAFAVASSVAVAQEDPFANVSIGMLKEKGEQAAVAAAAKLKRNLQSSYSGGVGGVAFLAKPSFDITATDDGLFDNANAGVDLIGVGNPDVGIFVLNAGVELGRNFDNYAGLLEVGWVYGIQPKDSAIGNLLNALVSEAPLIALQGGYKFAESTNDTDLTESQQSESKEEEDEILARVKFEAGLSTGELRDRLKFAMEKGADMGALGAFVVKGLNNDYLSVNPSARIRAWYDAANDDVYHQEKVGVEVGSRMLADTELGKMLFKKGKLDFSYSWGSGAPLFNRGEYFSAALKMDL